jgi:glycosyltransferase involved in cell wall biosynthesis
LHNAVPIGPFIGQKPHAEIPAYIKAMDCCLNPYVTGELADHVSPLKLYEYLAAGKPVVSSAMPEAYKFRPHVRIANSYEMFLSECDAVLSCIPEPDDTVQQRLELANTHSWEQRFQALEDTLDKVFRT